MKKEKRNIILTVVGNILFTLYLFTQAEVELDKLILTDDTQLFGTIIKKNIQGIEFKAQNEKSSRKVEFEKIHTFLYAEAKNQWELIYDAILTNNFSKAIEFLTSLESATKKQTMKEDIKFFLAICYFNQKNYDKFFSTLESLISEFSESFYLYHILAFIVEVLDLLEAKDISINLNTFVRQAISHLSKQKQEAISTISKLLEGYLKEASGSIDEGVSIYKEIRSQESAGYVVSTTATILLARHFIKKGKYEEAIKELNSKKVKLTTERSRFLLKNIWSLLADIYLKQAKEEPEKYLKKALYHYLNVYLIYPPSLYELSETYAKSLYHIQSILTEIAKTEKDEKKKNEYESKAAAIKTELKQKYGYTAWAEKIE